MTIQNIEDVMERIMSLNRNLTEDSLRTLLSASGWDKEDIVEGLQIFKTKNKNVIPTLQTQNFNTKTLEDVKKDTGLETSTDNNNTYTFNISKKTEENVANREQTTTQVTPNKEINHQVVNPSLDKTPPAAAASVTQNKETVPVPTPTTPSGSQGVISLNTQQEKNPSNGLGKAIFFILLILILGMAALYLYSSSFSNLINKKMLKEDTQKVYKETININAPDNQNYNTLPSVASSTQMTNSSSTGLSSNTSLSNSKEYESLLVEIANLKSELDSYKKTASAPKTIVKYISQRGPSGSAGRGISSIEATTTGFIINFTDRTSSLVPYSTTTEFNTINSKSVCFKDPNNPATSSNICLDRAAVLNILNK